MLLWILELGDEAGEKAKKKIELQHEFSRFFLSFAETSGIISQQDGMPLKLIAQ